jgi:YegS/Rv2252/BmrU family lipid kinase
VKSLFLVNRRSGLRRYRDVASAIRSACTGDFEIADCDDLDRVIERAIAEGVEVVYAVGGDGTVHEVAKRLIGTPLGVVPTGSGNGFARHIGLPIDIGGSLRSSRQQRIVTIDTATVNGEPFIGTMGIGFDAWVAHHFANSRMRGLQTYVALAARGFLRFASEEYELSIDGASERRRAFLIVVANANQYGNNARIAPVASLQDGVLDVVVVEKLSMLAIPRLFTGTLDRARGVRMLRGKRVQIRRSAAGPAQVDGEPVTLPALLTIEIVPQSLRVLVPDKRRGRL